MKNSILPEIFLYLFISSDQNLTQVQIVTLKPSKQTSNLFLFTQLYAVYSFEFGCDHGVFATCAHSPFFTLGWGLGETKNVLFHNFFVINLFRKKRFLF